LAVVRAGRELSVPPPRDRAALGRLLASSLGLVIRRAERLDAGPAELGARLARDLDGRRTSSSSSPLRRRTASAGTVTRSPSSSSRRGGAKLFEFRRNTIAHAG
jgi:hypothetical protein